MLRIAINGNWEPEDFIEVLQGIESLYYKGSISGTYLYPALPLWGYRERATNFDQFLENVNVWLLAEARLYVSPSSRLKVHRIEYGSPGWIDLVGRTGIVAVLATAIIWGIEFYDNRHIRAERLEQAKLETQTAEQNLRSLKLDIARKILQLREDFPDTWESEFLALTVKDLDKIFPRIAEGKIVGISSEDDER